MVKKGVHGATVERLVLAERVRELRDSGLLYREIMAELGISHSYAQSLVEAEEVLKTRLK